MKKKIATALFGAVFRFAVFRKIAYFIADNSRVFSLLKKNRTRNHEPILSSHFYYEATIYRVFFYLPQRPMIRSSFYINSAPYIRSERTKRAKGIGRNGALVSDGCIRLQARTRVCETR